MSFDWLPTTWRWPQCAQCKAPVERVEVTEPPAGVNERAVSLTAFCHGDRETTTLARDLLLDGVAFHAEEAFKVRVGLPTMPPPRSSDPPPED